MENDGICKAFSTNRLNTGEIIRENPVRYQTPFPAGPSGVTLAGVATLQQQQAGAQGVFCKKRGQRSVAGSRFCAACGSAL